MKKNLIQTVRSRTALTLAALSCAALLSAADSGDDPVIKLDPLSVTATRESKTHIETPASTVTLDKEDIRATGGDTAYEAVRFADGITSDSMGPAGQAWGAMTAKTVMRGSRRGTLVLVDGIPANVNGYYNMEDIPLKTVRQIEIVKGASSMLYGSEAIGGVINVITDNTPENTASVALGDYGYENYSFSLRQPWTLANQPGSIGVVGVYQQLGEVLGMSNGGYGFGGSIKRTGRIDLAQGNWSIAWQRTENEYSFTRYSLVGGVPVWTPDKLIQVSNYDDTKDFVRARGTGENWQASFYANFHDRDYRTIRNPLTTKTLSADIDYDANVIGSELQYNWKPEWASFVFGLSYQREHFYSLDGLSKVEVDSDRDNLAVFVRGEKTFHETWTAAVGVRESYVSTGDLTAFTPQFQLVKKLTKQFAAYANVARSFNMPTLKQLYDDTGTLSGANANLDPEQGWNYEAGLKWEGPSTLASLTVFQMDFDHITYVENTAEDRFYPQTVPFRNTGVEISVTQQLHPTLKLQAGASYGNPEEKSTPTAPWANVYGRVQANARLSWAWSRYNASFNISYLGDRVYSKDMAPTALKAGVSLGRWGGLGVSIDNVFDRQDVTNHTSATSKYYAMPRSYRISYEKTF